MFPVAEGFGFNRMIDGDESESGEFKYVSAILADGVPTCTGGILGAQLILTAAHYFIERESNQFINKDYGSHCWNH